MQFWKARNTKTWEKVATFLIIEIGALKLRNSVNNKRSYGRNVRRESRTFDNSLGSYRIVSKETQETQENTGENPEKFRNGHAAT